MSEGDVERYLTGRFPKSAFPADLAQVLHRRTDGNPLFLVNVLDYWLTQGALQQVNGRWTLQGDIKSIELGVPESLRQMIKSCKRPGRSASNSFISPSVLTMQNSWELRTTC